MFILKPYNTDYRELQYVRRDGRREISLNACLNHYFGGMEAVILQGSERTIFDRRHARPGDRVHIDNFSNHGFNGVLAAAYTADGRFGGHLELHRLAVVPSDTDQIRAHAALRNPSLADDVGTPLIDVGILRRETGAAVAITPGVSLGNHFVPAGYTYVEPVPDDHSAVHLVAYAREVAERYLPHSPVPLRFRTPWRQVVRESALRADGRHGRHTRGRGMGRRCRESYHRAGSSLPAAGRLRPAPRRATPGCDRGIDATSHLNAHHDAALPASSLRAGQSCPPSRRLRPACSPTADTHDWIHPADRCQRTDVGNTADETAGQRRVPHA